jgi:hypothetical protein
MRRYFSPLLVAAALSTVMAFAPAVAARPSSSLYSGPALTGPTVAHVGDAYTIDGSGFAPLSLVPLEIAEANGCCMALNMVADEYGRFSYRGDVWAPGTYTVRAWMPRNGNGRWHLAASWTFEAYP